MLVKPLVRPIVRAIAGNPTASLGSGFSPTSLFLDGSKGVVYDNNDLSSFYLDSAGTTAATVNGLVGLQLDKSAGLVLGAELVPTGDMSDISAWTIGGVGTTLAVVGGELEVTGGGGSFPSGRTPGFTTVVGDWYTVSATARRGTTASSVSIGSGAYSSALNASTSNQTLTFMFQAVGTTSFVACLINSGSGTGTAYFDNVTVKRLAGNHRYQTTTGSKPVLRGTPTGANLVTNGDFASGTGWTAGAGWAIGSGVATATASTTSLECTQFSVTIGKTYRVRYTMTRTGGSLVANMGGVNDTSRLASGTYEVYITATNTNPLRFTGFGPFTGTVDDVEVFDVSAGSVTAPYGLQYDGVDDFLQTAAVDFTATDKMFVCAGVRKLAQGVRQMLVEHNGGSLPGFSIEAPGASGTGYRTSSGGSALSQATTTGYDDTVSRVVSGVLDIVGDSAILRVNGTAVSTSVADQGTGNFPSATFFFGRRGGASLPLNGLDFGFVICGKTLTSTQISQTERYIAQRTGVVI